MKKFLLVFLVAFIAAIGIGLGWYLKGSEVPSPAKKRTAIMAKEGKEVQKPILFSGANVNKPRKHSGLRTGSVRVRVKLGKKGEER